MCLTHCNSSVHSFSISITKYLKLTVVEVEGPRSDDSTYLASGKDFMADGIMMGTCA